MLTLEPVWRFLNFNDGMVTLVKMFFTVLVVFFLAAFVALWRFKKKLDDQGVDFLSLLRGLGREVTPSDPRRGNGSIRGGFERLQRSFDELGRMFGDLLSMARRANDKLDGQDVELERLKASDKQIHERMDLLAKRVLQHIEGASVETVITDAVLPSDDERALGRVSSKEERELFRELKKQEDER